MTDQNGYSFNVNSRGIPGRNESFMRDVVAERDRRMGQRNADIAQKSVAELAKATKPNGDTSVRALAEALAQLETVIESLTQRLEALEAKKRHA